MALGAEHDVLGGGPRWKERWEATLRQAEELVMNTMTALSKPIPPGKFRVVGVDTFEGPTADWIEADFDTSEAAIAHANSRGRSMTTMHVYNDQHRHISEAGNF